MEGNKKLYSLAAMGLVLTLSLGMFTGCGSKTTTGTQNGASDTSQMKTNNSSVVKELVTAGTLTQAQGDKVLAKLNDGLANMGAGKGAAPQGTKTTTPATGTAPTAGAMSSPLASLVTDKTITQEQADAVMAKLMGNGGGMRGQGGAGGAMANADTSTVKTKYLDVAYASKSTAQKLDIYEPNSGSGPFPVIISIHGGAFKSGDKASGELTPMLKALDKGYVVVGVNYRLSGESKFPTQINDVKAAIRYIRANAAKYNINPDKIAVWGGSAGGSLAALAGTSGGVTALQDDSLGNAGVSDKVQAVVDWFGPINFSTMDAEFKALGVTGVFGSTSSASSPETAYLGKTVGTADAEALVKAASATTYITADDPAFFIEAGTKDQNVPYTQSVNLADALKKVIGSDKVTMTLLEGAGHGTSEFTTTENVTKVLDFLDKTLK